MFHLCVIAGIALALATPSAAWGESGAGLAKCAACHSRIASLPETLRTEKGLEAQLPWMNAELLDSMIEKARKAQGMTETEAEGLRAQNLQARRAASGTGAAGGFELPAKVRACYFTPPENLRRIDLLPRRFSANSVLSARLAKAIERGALIAYDRSTVPRTWQSERIAGRGTQSLMNEGIQIRRPEERKYRYPMAGASDEFPWKRAAATDLAPEVASHHYIIPADDGAIALPTTRSKASHPDYFSGSVGVTGPNFGWEFKPGTQFVEALSVTDPKSEKRVVVEIRTRMKTASGQWVADVLRPFASPKELVQATEVICLAKDAPAACSDASVKRFVAEVAKPRTTPLALDKVMTKEALKSGEFSPLDLNSVAHNALLPSVSVQKLSSLPPEIVSRLLQRPFQSVMARPWHRADGKDGTSWGAISDDSFHVFPKGTLTSHFKITHASCQRCHDTAGKHVKLYDPDRSRMNAMEPTNDEGGTRTWYNFVEGDDKIFSWHPFDPSAAKNRGDAFHPSSLARCLGEQTGLIDLKQPRSAARDLGRSIRPRQVASGAH